MQLSGFSFQRFADAIIAKRRAATINTPSQPAPLPVAAPQSPLNPVRIFATTLPGALPMETAPEPVTVIKPATVPYPDPAPVIYREPARVSGPSISVFETINALSPSQEPEKLPAIVTALAPGGLSVINNAEILDPLPALVSEPAPVSDSAPDSKTFFLVMGSALLLLLAFNRKG